MSVGLGKIPTSPPLYNLWEVTWEKYERIPPTLELEKFRDFLLYIGFETSKNSKPSHFR